MNDTGFEGSDIDLCLSLNDAKCARIRMSPECSWCETSRDSSEISEYPTLRLSLFPDCTDLTNERCFGCGPSATSDSTGTGAPNASDPRPDSGTAVMAASTGGSAADHCKCEPMYG